MSDGTDYPNEDLRKQRVAAYQICRERGHITQFALSVGFEPTKNVCRYCGTLYWDEVITHEENVPE